MLGSWNECIAFFSHTGDCYLLLIREAVYRNLTRTSCKANVQNVAKANQTVGENNKVATAEVVKA